jgi:hypothetical protein
VSFLTGAREAGYKVDVVLLDVPDELAAERRAERGSDQDERWLRGRHSKVENLRPLANIVLDGSWAPMLLAAELSHHPVIRTVNPAVMP